MADLIGQRLGNYTLLFPLGKGGFAEVYLGEHIYLKSLAAIKVLHAQLGTNEDTNHFISEARILVGLRHPHIVRVLEFGIEEDTPFLVMDYAPNGTLRQRYPQGTRLSPETVAKYIQQIASALQYAHNQKLIHRDIKPENLLFHDNDEVLLSDFGIALIVQTSRYRGQKELIGTAAYMAPEQIQGRAVLASDQYSLAIVAYEWLSGLSPFHGSFSEVCAQHMFTPPTPLREAVPTLSPEIEAVVMTALAKEPEKRFANIETFAAALTQACQTDYATRTAPTYPQISLSPSFPPANEWDVTSIRRPSDALAQQSSPYPTVNRNNPPVDALAQQSRPYPTVNRNNPPVDALAQQSRPYPVVNRNNPLIDDKSIPLTTKPMPLFSAQENRSSMQGRNGNFAILPMLQQTLHRRTLPVGFVVLLIILAVSLTGGLGFLYFTSQPSQQHQATGIARITARSQVQPSPTAAPRPTPTAKPQPSPTPTAKPQPTPLPQPQPIPTLPPLPPPQQGGVLALNDPLNAPSSNRWSVLVFSGNGGNVGGCSYVNGAYHATVKQAGGVGICMANATNFSNFTYQVNMTILSGTTGDGGGLVFRSANGNSYHLRIGSDGSFDLVDNPKTLVASSNRAINTGLNQTNVVKVKAQGTTISVYVNNVSLAQVNDSFSSSGSIGVFAVDFTQPTDVVFSQAQVWQ